MPKNADGEDLNRIQKRTRKKLDQCFIGTIHSFCGQLLRERPVEAGLPPDFSEVEEREEAVMRREAWDQFVQQRFLSEDPRLAKFEETGSAPRRPVRIFSKTLPVQRCTARLRTSPKTRSIDRSSRT